MENKLRIVYMGTPEFAVPCLEILVKNNYDVVGVITAPDKASGRGQKISTSPVKDFAVANNLKILQPTNLKDHEFIEELKSLNANLQIVVAFRMLPEIVWNMPEIGTFNLHASLLPQYRGAAPINWAIINGEKESGVSTFFLQHEIDTGDLLFQETEAIHEDDNVGMFYERLMNKGAKLVLKTVQKIEMGDFTTFPQAQEGDYKKAPKIFKEDCKIDWSKSSVESYNFVRGLSPYPCAWTILDNKTLKIYKATKTDIAVKENENIQTDKKTYLRFACNDYYLDIEELQIEGKKRMTTEEFLRGYRF
jgi:methionyl-tRNA formyltransferase